MSLANGLRIDIGRSLSSYNRKEYHHIFPRAFLQSKGMLPKRVNSLCNFCFLPASVNKQVADRAPSEYIFVQAAPTLWAQVPTEQDWRGILESNLMPTDKSVYAGNDYNQFLKLRAEAVHGYLKTIL